MNSSDGSDVQSVVDAIDAPSVDAGQDVPLVDVTTADVATADAATADATTADVTATDVTPADATPPDGGPGDGGSEACAVGAVRPCFSGAAGTRGVGPCRAGIQACEAPGHWAECVGEVAPRPEDCNGVDDDCNGSVDDVTRSCYAASAATAGVGPCRQGTQSCEGGRWAAACVGEVRPTSEVCNGIDDDCNGTTDDRRPDLSCGLGVCARTAPACVAGAPGTCTPGTPTAETCNRLDDDCDGAIDEDFDLRSDVQNCGMCGNRCSALCTASTCIPSLGLSLGRSSTCARLGDRDVRCWGGNYRGLLGDGTEINRATPTRVVGLTAPVAQVVTSGSKTCALFTDGTVSCWGSGVLLGDGVFMDRFTAGPVVPGLTRVEELAGNDSSNSTYALRDDRTVWYWGQNFYGQAGDGTTMFRRTPVQMPGLTNVLHISEGSGTVCALLTDASVVCWGYNGTGQIGDGTMTNRLLPVAVGLAGAAQISTGGLHTCARMIDGTVRCWGYGGSIGNGLDAMQLRPAVVSGLSDAVEIATGESHTCAVRRGGSVVCWGRNDYGQLGDGTRTNRLVPTTVLGLTGVAHVAAAGEHTCAQVSSGAVWCWGRNEFTGQLGDGSGTHQSTPVLVNWAGTTSGGGVRP